MMWISYWNSAIVSVKSVSLRPNLLFPYIILIINCKYEQTKRQQEIKWSEIGLDSLMNALLKENISLIYRRRDSRPVSEDYRLSSCEADGLLEQST